jgi:hypothetical protein
LRLPSIFIEENLTSKTGHFHFAKSGHYHVAVTSGFAAPFSLEAAANAINLSLTRQFRFMGLSFFIAIYRALNEPTIQLSCLARVRAV